MGQKHSRRGTPAKLAFFVNSNNVPFFFVDCLVGEKKKSTLGGKKIEKFEADKKNGGKKEECGHCRLCPATDEQCFKKFLA